MDEKGGWRKVNVYETLHAKISNKQVIIAFLYKQIHYTLKR